jgi:hypothetical protein
LRLTETGRRLRSGRRTLRHDRQSDRQAIWNFSHSPPVERVGASLPVFGFEDGGKTFSDIAGAGAFRLGGVGSASSLSTAVSKRSIVPRSVLILCCFSSGSVATTASPKSRTSVSGKISSFSGGVLLAAVDRDRLTGRSKSSLVTVGCSGAANGSVCCESGCESVVASDKSGSSGCSEPSSDPDSCSSSDSSSGSGWLDSDNSG